MTNEYTPGPWTARGDQIKGNGGLSPVALAYNIGERALTEANARLIAAAPELLGALIIDDDRECLAEAARRGAWAEVTEIALRYGLSDTSVEEAASQLRQQASGARRAAIAKARGQEVRP